MDIKFKLKIISLSERAIRILRKLLLATTSLRVIKYDTKIRLLIIATFSFFFHIYFFAIMHDILFITDFHFTFTY